MGIKIALSKTKELSSHMHEMSIAMNIVQIACREAESNGATGISKIELEIGSLSGVMVDSLRFCFGSACEGTPAQGAELAINEVQAEAQCLQCQHTFPIDAFMAICPECEAYEINVLKGRELQLKALSVN